MEFDALKQMPHSLEAEQSVIGALIMDPAVLDQIAGFLQIPRRVSKAVIFAVSAASCHLKIVGLRRLYRPDARAASCSRCTMPVLCSKLCAVLLR
jgi:hypothetical protein